MFIITPEGCPSLVIVLLVEKGHKKGSWKNPRPPKGDRAIY